MSKSGQIQPARRGYMPIWVGRPKNWCRYVRVFAVNAKNACDPKAIARAHDDANEAIRQGSGVTAGENKPGLGPVMLSETVFCAVSALLSRDAGCAWSFGP